MNSFWKLKNTKLLLANSITWLLFITFLVLALYFYNNANPYPERYTIADMDDLMIKQGQHISLIIIYSSIAMALFLFVLNLIVSSITLYNVFVLNNVSTSNKNGPCYEDMEGEYKTPKEAFWYSFWLFLFYLLYFLFGFILIIYLWLIHIKATTKHLNFNKLILNLNNGNFKKHSKKAWILVSFLWPILLFSSIISYTLLSKKDYKNNWIPDSYVKEYLTLSNNKPNIIQLYFDRSVGILWNLLLVVDDKINQENNSFIKMFPEFTSYLNSLSLSSITKTSNPSIYAGPLFHPYLKEHNAHNFFNSEVNSNLTLDDWYFNSLKAEIEMLKNNGIAYIGLNNLPYYRDGKMSWSAFGNMKALQDDINKNGIRNVITMTNAKLAEKIDKFYLTALESAGRLDYHVLSKLATNIQFDKTNLGGKFMTFFSQQTHEPYIYLKNGKLVQDKSRNGLVRSIWALIQELKPFFTRLKNEPFFKNGVASGSVYDNTLISIISDHGAYLGNVSLFADILNWLSNNNLINSESKNLLLNFDNFGFNPIISIKSFNENKPDFTFNTDQIVALSDLARIYEIELNKYNNQKNKAPYFLTEQNINKIRNKVLEDFVREQFLLNPLDPSVNSISNKTLNNRIFYLCSTRNWRYNGKKKTFDLIKVSKFEFDLTKNSFFYNDHFKPW